MRFLVGCGSAWLSVLGALSFALSNSAVSIGGINFKDNAFADSLISSFGTFDHPAGTLAQVLTDEDPATYAYSKENGAYVELGFTDNSLINGPGTDLAIFELGVPNTFSIALTIGGATKNYASTFTGNTVQAYKNQLLLPFSLNVSQVDLSDFGIADGASLNGVVIGLSIVNSTDSTVPTLSLVGALNSRDVTHEVPDGGSTLGLSAACALALLGLRRFLPQS